MLATMKEDKPKETHFTCTRCGKVKPVPEDSITTGYGTNDKGEKVCFACCADVDIEQMVKTGKACLYVVGSKKTTNWLSVVNWPATLSIEAFRISSSKNNFGAKRWDVWFMGPDGKVWHGVNVGDNQILRCKRTKEKR